MKTAILEVHPEALHRLLGLPKGAMIVDVRADMDNFGILLIKIVGAGYEVAEGEQIPRAHGSIQTLHSDAVNVTWSFDAAHQ